MEENKDGISRGLLDSIEDLLADKPVKEATSSIDTQKIDKSANSQKEDKDSVYDRYEKPFVHLQDRKSDV